MKKLSIFAIAALAAVGLSSCLKEKITPEGPISEGTHSLTLRLAGSGETRTVAVGAPGAAAAITLSDGHVYVFDAANSNTYVADEGFVATDLNAEGEFELAELVPEDAVVYVIGNLSTNSLNSPPSGSAVTLDDVLDYSGTFQNMVATTAVPLGTVTAASTSGGAKTFAPQAITVVTPPSTTAPGVASATIKLAPVVARLELSRVEDHADDDSITDGYQPATAVNASGEGYTVEGVYLTDYFPSYTLSGGAEGAVGSFTSTIGTTNYGNLVASNYGITAVRTAAAGVAVPSSTPNHVWPFNVAAGAPARLVVVVKSTNTFTNIADEDADLNTTESIQKVRNLIVQGYNAGALTSLSAGVIYRIAYLPFDSAVFSKDPNEEYELTVDLEVLPWGEENIVVDM